MAEYDFRTLSPPDFELLVQDLLQVELRIRLEGFKSGPDGGVDLRHSKAFENDIVVQCKRYLGNQYRTLKLNLEKKELPKVLKLNPKRYVVATSVPLTIGQKDELVSLLRPYCKKRSDVFGSEDLNRILRENPKVERSHFKLWLTSTEVLQRLLKHGIFTRSMIELEEIRRRISIFVPTEAVKRASKTLDKNGVCLLSGIPGVGKTTTAEILVAQLVEQGWECVVVSSDIEEAFEAFREKEKQVFIYDDFLGQTDLNPRLGKNEDQRLLQMMGVCKRKPKLKRLILTTREHVLDQGLREHEKLKRANLNPSQCVVALEDLTESTRAKILCNHLFVFDVNQETRKKFVESGAARRVIDHANYSPRVTETMCELYADERITPAAFGRRFIQLLDNPGDIWREPFENQIGGDARVILKLFALHESDQRLSDLSLCFSDYQIAAGCDLGQLDRRFKRAIGELENMFIRLAEHRAFTYVKFHNPAVKDFLKRVLTEEPQFLQAVAQRVSVYSVVLSAYEILFRTASIEPKASEIRSAIERTLNTPELRFFEVSEGCFPWTVSPPQRLNDWIRVLSISNASALTDEVMLIVDRCLTGWDNPVKDVSMLAKNFYEWATKKKFRATQSIEPLADKLLNHCNRLEDLRYVSELASSADRSKMLHGKVEQMFYDQSIAWVNEEIDSSELAEHADDVINDYEITASVLGVAEAPLTEERNRVSEMYEEKDDAEDSGKPLAEMDTEKSEADDILDSLRY
tara:strand:+ start:8103 stop:10343 length:2241 start_codon:yes stop_codon:yes gene_type:complete